MGYMMNIMRLILLRHCLDVSPQLLFLLTTLIQERTKEHKERLYIDDLIIQPIQRIPRYELLVKVKSCSSLKFVSMISFAFMMTFMTTYVCGVYLGSTIFHEGKIGPMSYLLFKRASLSRSSL